MFENPPLSRDDLVRLLAESQAQPPFPTISDRAAWHAVAERKPELVRLIRARAEAFLSEPIPQLPVTLYLDFDRTGVRETYQIPANLRRARLGALVLAECLEDRGIYMDAIMDTIWALCEESTWVWPAHGRGNVLPDPAHPDIDLNAAATALHITEAAALLGNKLNPYFHRRIVYEMHHRTIKPYLLAMDDIAEEGTNRTRNTRFWLTCQMNWNAVCTGGVVGTALYLEPHLEPGVLAACIEQALRSLSLYLQGFDQDGGSSEGPGYWRYGFLWYTILADLLLKRTNGKLNILDNERVQKIVRFPLETNLSGRQFVNFSDCRQEVIIEPAFLGYLAEHCALPELATLATAMPPEEPGPLVETLRALFWTDPHPIAQQTAYVPPPTSYYAGMAWLIARHGDLVLAAKGGNNGEFHNQNDIGNYIIHYRGESLIPDIGIGRYSKEYFGPNRYNILENSSRGHSVPLVNGYEQGTGKQFAAQVLAHTGDMLHIEMKDAYPPEAGLRSLQRSLTLQRSGDAGTVTLHDHVVFDGNGTIEEVFWTYAEPEQTAPNRLLLRGTSGMLEVELRQNYPMRIEAMPEQAFSRPRSHPVYRISISPGEFVHEAEFTLVYTVSAAP